MKVCPNCGTPAEMENQKFCMKCGTRFPDAAPAPQPAAPAAPTAPSQPAEPVAQPTEPVTPVQPLKPVWQNTQPEPAAEPQARMEVKSVTHIKREPQPGRETPPVQPEPQPAQTPQQPASAPPKPAEKPQQPTYTPPRPVQTSPQATYTPPQQTYTPPQQNRPAYEPADMPPAPPEPLEEEYLPELTPQPTVVKKTSPLLIVLLCLMGLFLVVALALGALLFLRSGVLGNLPFLSNLPGVVQQMEQDPESVLDEIAPSDDNASVPPEEDAQTAASPAPTTTPAPTATPEPTPIPLAEDQRFYLDNLVPSDDVVITVDGTSTSCYSDGSRMYIDRSALQHSNTLLRAIMPDGAGGYITSLALVSKTSNSTASFGAFYPCEADGYVLPDMDYIRPMLSVYYDGYLSTINTKDFSEMRYSSATNSSELTEKINSSANTGVTYDIDQSDMICDTDSVVYGDRVVTMNAMSTYVGTENTSGRRISGVNYMTVQAVWQNGMWLINHCVYISEDEYNAGTLAAMP